MLRLNSLLAVLHGARLDHSGAVARGFTNAAKHLTPGFFPSVKALQQR